MKKNEEQHVESFMAMSRAIKESRMKSYKRPSKIDLEKVLDMNQYTEEGKENMQSLANSLQKLYSAVSEDEFKLVIDLINGGHSLEVIDIGNAIIEANK